jgi:uncharacterized repeat protein (TIGR01451 family)
MIRSPRARRTGRLPALAGLAGVGVLTGTLALGAGAAWADAASPPCVTPGIDSGTITPPLPGLLVNAGTATVTVTGRTTGACGYAANASLHYWAANPTWHEATSSAQLGANPRPAGSVSKDEPAGATQTTYTVKVPASGEVWVGVKYRIPDKAPDLGFGVNESALLPSRVVVRTPPVINPPPPLLPHDNTNTPLTGTAWPGDTVTVRDQNGKVVCTAMADAAGRWNCTAAQRFPNGATSLTVSEKGTGANNPAYPGLSDATLPDLAGNTVGTHVITSDPAVTKGIDEPTPYRGQVVTYTVTATNNGPDTAVDVSVGDALPAGLQYVSHTVTAGSFDPAAGIWSGIGNLAKGDKQTLTLKAKVTERGRFTNPAAVRATGATDGTRISRLTGADGVPDWNLDATNDRDEAVLMTIPTADPRITKTVDRSRLRVGQIATYTIVASNNGPDTALGVTVSDLQSDGLQVLSATADVGTVDVGARIWTIGPLRVGDTATLTVRARITDHGSLENLARIRATGATDGTRSSARGNVITTNDTARAVVTTPQSAVTPVGDTTEPSPDGQELPVAAGEDDALPVTGPAAAPAMLAGLVAMLGGLTLLLARRRRPLGRHR